METCPEGYGNDKPYYEKPKCNCRQCRKQRSKKRRLNKNR